MSRVARRIHVVGVVQGVGFRPFVYRLAVARGLAGSVANDGSGLHIEVEGTAANIYRFVRALRRDAPPLARIDALTEESLEPANRTDFCIVASAAHGGIPALVPPDTATCDACLREMRDPNDRRYRYPFINCTDCGPRFTIATAVPYDRERTTMAAFPMCAACRGEYEDPASRRFHSEAIACAACGPRLTLVAGGSEMSGDEAITAAARLLSEGSIVAIKGVGGFHLAADAANEEAVARLRARKDRPHRPLALMARDLATVERIAVVDDAARALLTSREAPIVLLPKRDGAMPEHVAPALAHLGVMLPYTPLHHLLLADGPPLLVMTSANPASEPIVISNDIARATLADAFLVHDREIAARADDSLVTLQRGRPQLVRRARGHVPSRFRLPASAPPILAVGAEMKNTICATRGVTAWLSQHIGDVSQLATLSAFEEAIRSASRALGVVPHSVAHDLHPDYRSTRWALHSGLPRVPVQHHHAHIASCMAEHEEAGPVVGIAFDGTGCGPSGELWGGEVMVARYDSFERVAHLRPIALAGGETAIREPWRLALAALLDAGEPLDLLERIGERRERVAPLLAKPAFAPRTTSAGRWFDAVAALCGIRDEITYDGQAAIELEACAGSDGEPFAFELSAADAALEIDLRPTVREIAAALRQQVARSGIAARFHATLAVAVRDVLRRLGNSVPATVALSGGCFQNHILTARLAELLERDGRRVLLHARVPPNDGGISLGQAAVAASRLTKGGPP